MDRILVVVSYTDFKYYCRPLFPAIYDDLLYERKARLFVTDANFPGLSDLPSGDVICAEARRYGVEYAIKHSYDWVFFLDIDAIPDVTILDELLKTNHPFCGGVIPERGDSTAIIGHLYNNWQEKDRIKLNFRGQVGVKDVDGISGALMFVHKSIFEKVDYKGYTGTDIIPGRTTCDDEFYCIKVHDKLNITPKLNLNAKAWHLHSDGFAYRWYGMKKEYQRKKDAIIFGGYKYAEK